MKAVNEALRQHLNNDKYFVSCDLYELRLRSGEIGRASCRERVYVLV